MMERKRELGLHPPKVPLTVRVGVTGHRKLDDVESLRPTITSVLSMVRDMSVDLLSDRGSPYLAGKPSLRLISPLAEGADRVVAEEALKAELGFDLQCPFPFSEDEYLLDFQDPASIAQFKELRCQATAVLELDGHRDDCSGAPYETVGRVVLRQSDLLIAIWDGQPARGRGGTAQVVTEALEAKIPVIMIDPACPKLVRLVRSVEPLACGDIAELCERFRAAFLVPPQSNPKKSSPSAGSYFMEREPHWSSAIVFGLLNKIFVRRIKLPRLRVAFEQSALDQWDPSWHSLSEAEVRPQIDAKLRAHFAWADGLAELYANRYRSSFTLNYLLSAMVVLVAFLGHFTEMLWGSGDHSGAGLGVSWTLVELGLIVAILMVTIVGRRNRWHERWMDYRWLAESLRQMQYLGLFARVMPSLRVPAHMEYEDPRQNWANWFLRAILRDAGMVQVRIDEGYLADCRKLMASVARSQATYHRKKGKESRTLGHRIHRAGEVLFVLAALGCLIHLADSRWWHFGHQEGHELFRLAVGFLVLVSPALGAAFAAILHHGEFERISARSLALAERLQSTADLVSCPAKPLSFRTLGRSAEELADILVSELVDWRYVFLDKNIVLPG